jgi:hypothetical protein
MCCVPEQHGLPSGWKNIATLLLSPSNNNLSPASEQWIAVKKVTPISEIMGVKA